MGVRLYKRCSGRHIVLLAVLCFTKIYESQSVCSGTVFFTRVRCFSDFKDTTFEEYDSSSITFSECANKCASDFICTCFYFDGRAKTPMCKLFKPVTPMDQGVPPVQKYFLLYDEEGKYFSSAFK